MSAKRYDIEKSRKYRLCSVVGVKSEENEKEGFPTPVKIVYLYILIQKITR